MFMISRRAGERLVIGNEIEIVVTEIRRRTVRLGVNGGADKQVLRGEVHDAIVQANRWAAEAAIDENSLEAVFAACEALSDAPDEAIASSTLDVAEDPQ
jgi:carbon storage regulator